MGYSSGYDVELLSLFHIDLRIVTAYSQSAD